MNTENAANRGEIIIYRAEDNTVQLDVRMEQETVWLTQDQMASLFGRDKSVISRHIKRIFETEELVPKEVVAFFATTTPHGFMKGQTQRHEVTYYNLDMIISVGYKVNSKRGVEFRRWATKILKDFLIKGYAINDKIRREQLADLRQLVQIVRKAA